MSTVSRPGTGLASNYERLYLSEIVQPPHRHHRVYRRCLFLSFSPYRLHILPNTEFGRRLSVASAPARRRLNFKNELHPMRPYGQLGTYVFYWPSASSRPSCCIKSQSSLEPQVGARGGAGRRARREMRAWHLKHDVFGSIMARGGRGIPCSAYAPRPVLHADFRPPFPSSTSIDGCTGGSVAAG
ncbi:hypothetical protein LZ30DRAFT_213383 [Colletotrichum cereale]|nr:hypothetical protein LZ30DRAFT_213383 [Colletotrichum cereale]